MSWTQSIRKNGMFIPARGCLEYCRAKSLMERPVGYVHVRSLFIAGNLPLGLDSSPRKSVRHVLDLETYVSRVFWIWNSESPLRLEMRFWVRLKVSTCQRTKSLGNGKWSDTNVRLSWENQTLRLLRFLMASLHLHWSRNSFRKVSWRLFLLFVLFSSKENVTEARNVSTNTRFLKLLKRSLWKRCIRFRLLIVHCLLSW